MNFNDDLKQAINISQSLAKENSNAEFQDCRGLVFSKCGR